MSDDDLPALDDDIRTLVDRAGGIRAAPAGAKSRVFDKVETALGPSGGGGLGGDPGSSTTPGLRSWARRLASGALVFTLGGLTGAIVAHAVDRAPAPPVREAPPRIVYVERPAQAVASAEGPSDERPPEAPRWLEDARRTSRVRGPATAPTATPVRAGVSEERMLLDGARGALEREEWEKALAATREHERRFPNGLLVQEREFMAAKALAMMGRTDEARAHAVRLRARFPDSMLLPALDSLLDAGPPALP